jgi:hypothetical protein
MNPDKPPDKLHERRPPTEPTGEDDIPPPTPEQPTE